MGRGWRVGEFLVSLLRSRFRPEPEHIGLDHPDGPGASFERRDNADAVFDGSCPMTQPGDGEPPNRYAVPDGHFGIGLFFRGSRYDKRARGTGLPQVLTGENTHEPAGGFRAQGATGPVGRNGVHQELRGSRKRDLLNMHDDTVKDFSGFSGESVSFFFADSSCERLYRNHCADSDEKAGGEKIFHNFVKKGHCFYLLHASWNVDWVSLDTMNYLSTFCAFYLLSFFN